jgi:hypothetical protein
MPNPVFKNRYIYGVGFMCELRCLNEENSVELWQSCAAMGGRKKPTAARPFSFLTALLRDLK